MCYQYEAYSRKQEHYTVKKRQGGLLTDQAYLWIFTADQFCHPLPITYSCQLCEEAQSPILVVENPFPLQSCWCFLAPVQNHWGEILLILMACSPLTYCWYLLIQEKKSKSVDSKMHSFLHTPDIELSTQK